VLQIGRSLVRSQLVSVDFSLIYNPSDRTMALGSTQPLTEMSTRSISWVGQGGRRVRLPTYHHPVPLSRNLGTLTSWNPLGLSRPVMGLLYVQMYYIPHWSETVLAALCLKGRRLQLTVEKKPTEQRNAGTSLLMSVRQQG